MYILLGIGGLDMGFDVQDAFLGKSLPLYKHRSKNVISSVENSAVKLMRWCRSLMLSNCSRLSFVSVHTKNVLSMYLFQCMGEGFVSERILDSSAPMKMLP